MSHLLLVLAFAVQQPGPASALQNKALDGKAQTDSRSEPLPKGAVLRFGPARQLTGASSKALPVIALAFSPNSHVLALGFEDWTLALIDLDTGRELRRVSGYRPLQFHPDGQALLVMRRDQQDYGTPAIYDFVKAEERSRLTQPRNIAPQWTLSPDGKVLVTMTRRRNEEPVRVWDVTTGRTLCEMRGKEKYFYAACSLDAKTVAIHDSTDGPPHKESIYIFGTDTGKEIRRLAGCSVVVEYAARRRQEAGSSHAKVGTFLSPVLSPNGRRLLAGSGQYAVRLWDLATGKVVVTLPTTPTDADVSGNEFAPGHAVFSRDGQLLAVLDSHGDCCLLDAITGGVLQHLAWEGGDLAWIVDSANRAFSPDGRELVVGYDDHTLVLWELVTCQPVVVWRGDGKGELQQMLFSNDGRYLATLSKDGTALVWDVTGTGSRGRLPQRQLTAAELEQAWQRLAGADAAEAHKAMWHLVGARKQAVDFLRPRLRPIESATAGRLAELLAGLDSSRHRVREQAQMELERLGEVAAPALQRALQGDPSPEVRQRLKTILAKAGLPVRSEQAVRSLRAVAVLESIGTSESREVLRSLAAGAPESRLTQSAKSALERAGP